MSETIVVGVDASEPSKDALRWAARQAELTGAGLHIVMAWEIPSMGYWAAIPQGLDLGKEAEKALQSTIEEVLGSDPKVAVRSTVAEGHAPLVLLEAAHDADLLVVGSRGHGEFAGMLIGSVSEYCVTHAHCPVVVLRKHDH